MWLTWVGLPAIAFLFWLIQSWWAGAIIIVAGILGQIFYIRYFPKMSSVMGYGSVKDEVNTKARPSESVAGKKVTLYTANVCPFCPIVKERLQKLQDNFGFELKEIDVTFQPKLIKEKGFRSVPVIEFEGKYWTGNATTAELTSFLVESQDTGH